MIRHALATDPARPLSPARRIAQFRRRRRGAMLREWVALGLSTCFGLAVFGVAVLSLTGR